MAGKKRRSKHRRTSQRENGPTTTVSSDHTNPSTHTGRLSGDETASELAMAAAGDDITTAETSIMDTDDCTSEESDAGDEAADRVSDMRSDAGASMYAMSQYPGMSGSFRGVAMSSSSQAASIRSLWALDLDYRDIHGRRYCSDYYIPIDDMELMRQALIHQVFLHVMDGEITNVPLHNPVHALDVGTGAGDWAIRLAELYPNCEVVGTDIAAVAETSSVPINVFFEIEDAEDWDRLPDHYDLVHFRCMEGAFRDWDLLYDNVFASLKPGGWIELQDLDGMEGIREDFQRCFPPESPLHAIMEDLRTAADRRGRSVGSRHLEEKRLTAAGFVDVQTTVYDIPITVAEQSAGKIWLISCLDAYEALGLRLLTEEMGWDPEECKAACEQAARDLANIAKDPEKSKGLSVKMRVVIGRKPLDAPLAPAVQFDQTTSASTSVDGSPVTRGSVFDAASLDAKMTDSPDASTRVSTAGAEDSKPRVKILLP